MTPREWDKRRLAGELEAFPTASGIPGSRSATSTTNLAVTISTVARVE